MCYEDHILLKIKRDFTVNEKVQIVLKQLSAKERENGKLQREIGMLKSELHEKDYEIHQLRYHEVDSKKGWMKDELIAEMDVTLKTHAQLYMAEKKMKEKLELQYIKALMGIADLKKRCTCRMNVPGSLKDAPFASNAGI